MLNEARGMGKLNQDSLDSGVRNFSPLSMLAQFTHDAFHGACILACFQAPRPLANTRLANHRDWPLGTTRVPVRAMQSFSSFTIVER